MGATRQAQSYHRLGHPFDGVPLSLADASFNRQAITVPLSSDSYGGPNTVVGGAFTHGWLMTDNGVGTGSVVGDNAGQLVLTCGTTDEDNSQIQQLLTPVRYNATANKIQCFARIAVGDADATDAFFGLAVQDSTIIVTSTEDVTDCIGFFKAATASDWSFLVQKDGTTTTTAAGLTLTDGSFAIIGFVIDQGAIRMYAVADDDDQVRNSPQLLGSGTSVVNTNAPDDIDTHLSVVVGNEGGAAETVTVDWAFLHATHT